MEPHHAAYPARPPASVRPGVNPADRLRGTKLIAAWRARSRAAIIRVLRLRGAGHQARGPGAIGRRHSEQTFQVLLVVVRSSLFLWARVLCPRQCPSLFW